MWFNIRSVYYLTVHCSWLLLRQFRDWMNQWMGPTIRPGRRALPRVKFNPSMSELIYNLPLYKQSQYKEVLFNLYTY